jgi:hypothetical protein
MASGRSAHFVEPSATERVANEIRWQGRYRGLDVDDAEERAKQIVKQGGRKPRFEKAPK